MSAPPKHCSASSSLHAHICGWRSHLVDRAKSCKTHRSLRPALVNRKPTRRQLPIAIHACCPHPLSLMAPHSVHARMSHMVLQRARDTSRSCQPTIPARTLPHAHCCIRPLVSCTSCATICCLLQLAFHDACRSTTPHQYRLMAAGVAIHVLACKRELYMSTIVRL